MPKQISFMSVHLTVASKTELLEGIDQASSQQPLRIATINPEFLLDSKKYPTFRQALERMLCVIDGSGLKMALAVFGGVKTELYHGADLVQDLFKTYQAGGRRFYFIGDKPGVAEQAKEVLQKRFPTLEIVGAEEGGQIDPQALQLNHELVTRILTAKPDILLVAYGAPKQELWIDAARELAIPVMIGVGGSLGFYGSKTRAPRIWSSLHLEWLYRSLTEKGHAKRAFRAVIIFPLAALGWKLTHLGLSNKDAHQKN